MGSLNNTDIFLVSEILVYYSKQEIRLEKPLMLIHLYK